MRVYQVYYLGTYLYLFTLYILYDGILCVMCDVVSLPTGQLQRTPLFFKNKKNIVVEYGESRFGRLIFEPGLIQNGKAWFRKKKKCQIKIIHRIRT